MTAAAESEGRKSRKDEISSRCCVEKAFGGGMTRSLRKLQQLEDVLKHMSRKTPPTRGKDTDIDLTHIPISPPVIRLGLPPQRRRQGGAASSYNRLGVVSLRYPYSCRHLYAASTEYHRSSLGIVPDFQHFCDACATPVGPTTPAHMHATLFNQSSEYREYLPLAVYLPFVSEVGIDRLNKPL